MSETLEQFICFLEPTREGMPEAPTPEEGALARAHYEYCARLRDEGTLILAGRTQSPPHVGVVIFEAPDRAAAERVIAQDPGVSGGIFKARVQPYRVALARTE